MGVAVAAGIRSAGGVAWKQEMAKCKGHIFYLHGRWVPWWVGGAAALPPWHREESGGGGAGKQKRGRIEQYDGGATGCPHWSESKCWGRAAFISVTVSTL